ncbi:hypothetical protein K435DRAFT_799030 [Dendrothele bispora CBS 962.96]|uniref:Uncharacterized protein n=1 Tax=Dendrothele bispora (strain CBS 962.96) TaxID=1314807 RepID=A0A4S8LX37_DENBC|nr:hypothetical protein K435DRAFT_799030 [Dendrothele bispora CBS 962.96]
MGVIFASRIPGVGTSIDLDTDGIYLNDTAVEGSTLASGAQVSSSHSAYSSVINSESSFVTSVSTANTLATNNGRKANNNSSSNFEHNLDMQLFSSTPLPAKLRLHLVLQLQLIAVLPFHDITYSNNETQGSQEGTSITQGGERNVAPNDSGDKSTSALPKSTIIGVSAIGGVINNEGVNLDVVSYEALLGRVNLQRPPDPWEWRICSRSQDDRMSALHYSRAGNMGARTSLADFKRIAVSSCPFEIENLPTQKRKGNRKEKKRRE